MPTQNLELLNSLMDQVKKEWSIPADCNDNNILFDVVREAFIRYEAEVNKVDQDDDQDYNPEFDAASYT